MVDEDVVFEVELSEEAFDVFAYESGCLLTLSENGSDECILRR